MFEHKLLEAKVSVEEKEAQMPNEQEGADGRVRKIEIDKK